MYAQVKKLKENKSKAVANSVGQKKNEERQGVSFVDNRPYTNLQRNLVSQNKSKKTNATKGAQRDNLFLNTRCLPIQLKATFDDVRKIGEKILGHKVKLLNSDKELNKVPTQKKVVQRLISINLGNPYTFQVVPGDLGTGTGTTVGTRAFVNGVGVAPMTVSFAYGFFNGWGGALMGAIGNVAPNPPIPGVNYDAGHALGRQNGGLGNVNNWVFPQNRDVNRGWAGTFPQWRAHENFFNTGVSALPPGGFGIWHVTLP